MDGDDGGVMAQPTFTLHQPSEPKKKIQKKEKTIYIHITFCEFAQFSNQSFLRRVNFGKEDTIASV